MARDWCDRGSGGGLSAILEIILRSASVSARTHRCDERAQLNSVIYPQTVSVFLCARPACSR